MLFHVADACDTGIDVVLCNGFIDVKWLESHPDSACMERTTDGCFDLIGSLHSLPSGLQVGLAEC